MASLLTRGWIALGILVATPMVGWGQRGSNDADTYPESSYGDTRPEAEPPRLFRGGLMHQLRSVTESVLGGSEEEQRSAGEPNRNIPKPPPLSSQNYRSTPSGRAHAPEETRGDQQAGSSAPQNRNWAGQFLVPNSRSRSEGSASRQAMPNERGIDRRVYPGQQRTGQQRTGQQSTGQRSVAPREPSSGSPSRAGSIGLDKRYSEPPVYSENDDAFPQSEGISLNASDSAPSAEDAVERDKGPAEVVVSHVPDVPYVPRKPLPKRGQKSPSSELRSDTHSEIGKSQTPTGITSTTESTSSAASPTRPSTEISEPTEESLNVDSSNERFELPAAPQPEPSANDSSSKPSLSVPQPSIPSLEGGSSLPGLNAPSQMGNTSTSQSPTSPSLTAPSLSPPNLPTSSLPPAGSLEPSLPELSPSVGNEPSSIAPEASLPGSSLPGSSLPSLDLSGAAAGASPTVQTETSATAAAPAAGGNQERMRMEVPHVVVRLLGPGDLATGTPTGYEVVVQNADRIGLSGLILRMETPPGVEIVKNAKWGDAVELEKAEDGATLLMWNVAPVAAGGTIKLPLDLKATTPRNFAVAIEWTVLPQEGIDELTVKQPDLQVALEGPVDVEKDIANVYRVRVSNPGNALARNVKVQVSAAAQQASAVEIGDLAAGQSEVVEMDLTFEKAGRLEIGAQALAEGSLKRNTNIVVNVRQPVLKASLSVPKNVLLGGNVFATMELRNSGDGPARNVQAGLMVPADTEVINPPSGVTRQGDKLLWEVEIVPPGQVVTVPIELRLPNPGTHGLKFACVTPAGALTSAEASTTVEAFADLKLLVNDPPAPAPIGAPVVYELTVTNRGNRDARNVTILAQFSEGIEPQNASGLKNRVVPGQVLFDPIPTIPAGETVKIKLTAKASIAGMHRFRAEVRCEESDARLVEEESTRYLESASRIASPPSTLIQR